MAEDASDELLRQFLASRDVLCPGCQYNIRNLTSGICPECGQAIELSVRLVEPRQAGLIAGLIGLSAGCGLGGLLLVYAAITILVRGERFGIEPFILINVAGFVAHGAALAVWVRRWNQIRMASSGARRLLVLVCWAMPLSFIVIFAAYVR